MLATISLCNNWKNILLTLKYNVGYKRKAVHLDLFTVEAFDGGATPVLEFSRYKI